MKWRWLFAAAGILAVVYGLRAGAALPEEKARELLKAGAVLVDVRTVGEFNDRHLTNAVNIPLDELAEKTPRIVRDKGRVLLLHCRSGRRSGLAEKKLRDMGYTNAFNIGSYRQAETIVNPASR